ncbi:hypothetical protein BGX28_000449 [Mortierella sp. GBA30]|nr:hypothetical protein BGX28_000449 [Mortierella sp. GBA30]
MSHRKSIEPQSTSSGSGSGSGGSGAGSGNNSAWTSPSSSSFSRFQDYEVPLGGTTELNDDAKEKSLRRRSLLDERAARRRSLLSSVNAPGSEDDRRRSMNNNNNNSSNGNNLTSPNKLRPSGSSSLLGVVESHQPPLPSLLKVSADSFEQWLKLATDNKINANNSWNFALIDYFHEMSLLREGDSINFQKASCTLDGCVKIYTSRVDSVATETTKLLGGLATSSKNPEGEGGPEDNHDSDEEQDKPAKKKSSSRSGNTLAKDFSALSLEKFNLEFSVDPLFKKTSADFDEGGARGLLLNHLNVDAEGKIIFDAGDARDEGDDDDDENEDEEEEESPESLEQSEKEKKSKRKNEVEAAMIDIQRLRSRFLPALNQIFEKDICPSLKDFQLTGTSDMDFSFLKRFQGDGDDEDEGQDSDTPHNHINDFDDDGDDNDFGMPDFYDDTEQDNVLVPDQDDEGLEVVEHHVVEDAFGDLDQQIAIQRAAPPPADNNMIVETDDLLGKGQVDMYSYFDSALLRNWAGPEHWKLRRIQKDKAATGVATGEGAEDEQSGAGPKKRSAKVPLVIDFLNAPEVDEDELFASAEATSLMFTAANEAEHQKTNHTLPDDVHFSSKQLLRMFVKPTFIIKSKNKKPQFGYRQNAEQESFATTFPDEEFWASHTNNVDESNIDALTDQLDQTQIYNDYLEDDDDDYGYGQEQGFFAGIGGESIGSDLTGVGSGLGMVDGDGNDYASQLVSQPKRVKATFITFSKTAKKVDVKKLKDNIWKEMTQQQSLKRQPARGDEVDRKRTKKKANLNGSDDDDAEDGVEEEDDSGDDEGDYVKKEQKFTEIIGGLSKMYPEQKLKEISVPFCFICLLHLANEKNLSIEGSEDLAELVIRQQ